MVAVIVFRGHGALMLVDIPIMQVIFSPTAPTIRTRGSASRAAASTSRRCLRRDVRDAEKSSHRRS